MTKTFKTYLIITVLVIIAGIVWYANKSDTDIPVNTDNNQDQVVDRNDEILSDDLLDTSDWQIYKNEEYGFEFKYPENWDLSDTAKDSEVVSISSYFINSYENKDGSNIKIKIEENEYSSFDEWLEQNFYVFENSTISENKNFDFLGFQSNLIRSTSSIAGGNNDRLSLYNEQKKIVFVIWSYSRIRSELVNEIDSHRKTIDQIINTFKIN